MINDKTMNLKWNHVVYTNIQSISLYMSTVYEHDFLTSYMSILVHSSCPKITIKFTESLAHENSKISQSKIVEQSYTLI